MPRPVPRPVPRKTKTQRTAHERLRRDLQFLGGEDWITLSIREEIPEAWHTLEQDVEVAEKKTKVTLYLDASVARFYRAMGHGYQERINRLLSTWMNMKIAEDLELERMLEMRMGAAEYEAEKAAAWEAWQAAKGQVGIVE